MPPLLLRRRQSFNTLSSLPKLPIYGSQIKAPYVGDVNNTQFVSTRLRLNTRVCMVGWRDEGWKYAILL